MNTATEVYILEHTNDVRFHGFGLADPNTPSLIGREYILKDLLPCFSEKDFVHLADKWKPLKVIGRVQKFQDYPSLEAYPVFSERACNVLQDFLQPNGELLSLESKLGNYFVYNLTNVLDALDLEKSIYEMYRNEPRDIYDVNYFVFNSKKLGNQSIFTIYEEPGSIMVTKIFVDVVRKNNLNGFRFLKIWPIPEGEDWRVYHRNNTKDEGGSNLEKEGFIVSLQLKSKKINNDEKERITVIEDHVNEILQIESLSEIFFGDLLGYDELEGEYQMLFFCPNADKLEKKLLPYFNSIDWDRPIDIIKIKGAVLGYVSEREEGTLSSEEYGEVVIKNWIK